MIRFGIVGTNIITEAFLSASVFVNEFKLTAVYSRSLNKAKEFSEKYGAEYFFDNIEGMAKSPYIDAVYIASPNALHCEQACLFLRSGKHVLCEKPIASNLAETNLMIQTAIENNVVLMEAMKTCSLPNYLSIKKNINKIGKVRHISSHYCQYSSRYDRFKEGEVMNAFKPELSNGSLMDLGVYAIYPVIDLFGFPEGIKASAIMLGSGVDGCGSALLEYNDLIATVSFSKITDMKTFSEIQGENGSIIIDHISQINSSKIIYRDGSEEDITVHQSQNPMEYELNEFITTIKAGKLESSINNYSLMLHVSDVMQSIRKQIGLVFPSDRSFQGACDE